MKDIERIIEIGTTMRTIEEIAVKSGKEGQGHDQGLQGEIIIEDKKEGGVDPLEEGEDREVTLMNQEVTVIEIGKIGTGGVDLHGIIGIILGT